MIGPPSPRYAVGGLSYIAARSSTLDEGSAGVSSCIRRVPSLDLTDVEPTDAYTPDSDGLVIELDENVVMTFWTSLLARVLARRRAERLS
jgi:hypothetical protein